MDSICMFRAPMLMITLVYLKISYLRIFPKQVLDISTYEVLIYIHLNMLFNIAFRERRRWIFQEKFNINCTSPCSVSQLCLSLCYPMDYSLSSVHGIFQARILEWVDIYLSRRSSQPRDQTWIFCIAGRCFYHWATRDPPNCIVTKILVGLRQISVSLEVYFKPP